MKVSSNIPNNKGMNELIQEALKGCTEKQLKMIYQFILGIKKGR